MEIKKNANVSFNLLEHWIQSVFVIYSSIFWESERMAKIERDILQNFLTF